MRASARNGHTKVVSAKEMGRIEACAYKEGASEVQFMEAAGRGVADVVSRYLEESLEEEDVVTLLCGKGNNAGDAYVAGKVLFESGLEVTALQLAPLSECSPLCREYHQQFIASGGKVLFPKTAQEIQFPHSGVILDGIFGTGFHGEVEGLFALAIQKANDASLTIFSIDIPSGINGSTGEVSKSAICAAVTIYLGLAKSGFFTEEAWEHVGKLEHVDFGLAEKYLQLAHADYHLVTREAALALLPPMHRKRHKYTGGFVVALAGSVGMPGAAALTCLAALRSGAGIVHLLHPEEMSAEFSGSFYELVRRPYGKGAVEGLLSQLNQASAALIGPGMGQSPEAVALLKKILPEVTVPSVIDADALNIAAKLLGGNFSGIKFPGQSVLTPHVGEMHRLLRIEDRKLSQKELLEACRTFCEKQQVTLILKGSPSYLFSPGEKSFISPYGDPGMATAGSGDVLTGIIAALLAQGLSCFDAALLGLYLHGSAGEYAAQNLTSYSMLASDIIHALPHTFHAIL